MQRRYAQIVQSSADQLLGVLNDILDFSKIEAGKLALEALPFDPREAVEQVLVPARVDAQKKQLTLRARVADEVPDRLVGDAMRIRQVLFNLVNNAIKFTQSGSVELRLECVGSDADSTTLRFAVRDTGIGIAEDKRALIFDPFSQADSSMTRRFGGTGLGLSISSRLVEVMGGRIELQSELGRGSEFSFELRLANAVPVATGGSIAAG